MHRRRMEKAEVDVIVILDFLAFGRAVVCDEDEVDQSRLWGLGLGTCLGCVMITMRVMRSMRRQLDTIVVWIETHGKLGSLLANGDGHPMRES